MQKTIDFVEFAAMINVAHLTTMILIVIYMGGARNFPKGRLTLPTWGLKYGFQGTMNAKISEKMCFQLPTRGYSPLVLPWRHPWHRNVTSIYCWGDGRILALRRGGEGWGVRFFAT